MRWVDELPDAGEVVVVVFGDKVKMVDEAHGRLEARVRNRANKDAAVELVHAVEKLFPGSAKFSENLFEVPCVVVGFVCLAILQVGGGEFGAAD